MKKAFVIFLLLMFPVKVFAETGTLYDAMKEEAESGSGIVKEYTREHQDTVDGSGKDKIYYFNASSNETADAIINKRNVIFGGFCWEMYRTTDSGGVKLLYNGVVSNGKCNGYGQSIGSYNYTIYENINSIASIGYMYNKMYSGYEYVTPTYGSYIVNGTNISESNYKNVSMTKFQDHVPETNSYPYKDSFSFTSKGWRNIKTTEGYSRSGSMTFNLDPGNYVIEYNFDFDFYSDRVEIYKNGENISSIVRQEKGIALLNDVKSTDVIKVELDLMSSYDQHSDFYFNVKIPSSAPVDTRAYFGNSVKYENGKYTLVDTIRSDGTNNLAYNHYFCKDGTTSCTDVYYTMGWYYPTQMQSFKLSNGMTIEKFVNDQLYADDVNKYDSSLKKAIDNWYEHNLTDYTKYLEKTVFCQNRNFAYDYNALNPNGGNPTGGSRTTYFYRYKYSNYSAEEKAEDYLYNSNLMCENETDRFSVANEKAKLKYPVATINYAEALLLFGQDYDQSPLYGQKVRQHNINYSYWLLSPHDIAVSYGWGVSQSGGIYYSYGSNTNGVRPVISLKKGIEYESGTGSKEDPYVIKEYKDSKIIVEQETDDGVIHFNVENLDQVMESTIVEASIDVEEGYVLSAIKIIDTEGNEIPYEFDSETQHYIFRMPDRDVRFISSYDKKPIIIPINNVINPNTTTGKVFITLLVLIISFVLYFVLNKRRKDLE